MPRILITPAAEDDLVNLWVYIARENRSAADRVYDAVGETITELASMPTIGALYRPKRTRLEGIRLFPVKRFQNYIIYYRPIADGIEIIRVLHTRMERNRKLENYLVDPS